MTPEVDMTRPWARTLRARMVRLGVGLAVAMSTAPVVTHVGADAQAAAPRTVDGRIDDWHGQTTGLGGTWQVSDGELVYQDHLFDDLGPETNQRAEQHGTVGAPKGDYRYPDEEALAPEDRRYANNAADLQELRLAADHENVWVLARMSTLKVTDTTVIAIAFDTDGSESTGGGAWPHGAGIAAKGADRVITMWGTGGSVTDLATGVTTALADDAVAAGVDNANNAIEASIPRAKLGATDPHARMKVWAATGLWDASGAGEWMTVPQGSPAADHPGGGSPLVGARAWNVAFRDDESGSFMEERQAAALATGDITELAAPDVDLAELAAHGNRRYEIKEERFYAVIVDTGFSIPEGGDEGVSYDGVSGRFAGVGGAALQQVFEYFGRYQPYGLYIPSTYDATTPLPAALVLHGLGGSHSSYNRQPGFLHDMGESDLDDDGDPDLPPMYLVTPLARGSSFYADWGEAETLDVLADAMRRVPVDPDRLYLTGYSMGGYGVYRLASLYPDRFAAAVSWAGYTGEVTGSYLTQPVTDLGTGDGSRGKASIGDPVDTLENLRYLPLLHMGGTNDEIVPTAGQYAAPRRLAELGYRSRFDLYAGYEHFSFALVDDWRQARAWLGDQRREQHPRQIDYRFSDGWTDQTLPELGIVHGTAWWLRDLEMRDHTTNGLQLASAHAESGRIGEPAHTVASSTTPSSDPTPHVEQLVSWTLGEPLALTNQVTLALDGVSTATVDLPGAALDGCGLAVALRTDGPTSIRLADRFPPGVQLAGPGGATLVWDRSSGNATINLSAAADGTWMITCPPTL